MIFPVLRLSDWSVGEVRLIRLAGSWSSSRRGGRYSWSGCSSRWNTRPSPLNRYSGAWSSLGHTQADDDDDDDDDKDDDDDEDDDDDDKVEENGRT